MAVISIDLDAMRALVDALDEALVVIPEAADSLWRSLDSVWLSCDGLGRCRAGGSAVIELQQLRAECQQRLDMAIAINASTPGVPRVKTDPYGYQYLDRMVTFDEDDMDKADAIRAAALMAKVGSGEVSVAGGIPDELLTLLLAGMNDSLFAGRLAELVPPEALALFLDVVDLDYGARSSADSADSFTMDYASLLDALGTGYSLALESLSPDSSAYRAFIDKWAAFFTDDSSPRIPAIAFPLVSMVVARGQWPDVFLTAITEAIATAEGGEGASYWDLGVGSAAVGLDGRPRVVVDPGRSTMDGDLLQVSDPMYGVWSAAIWNPDWFWETFHGDLTDVVRDRTGYDGSELSTTIPEHVDVDSRVAALFRTRGFDEASLLAFMQAAQIADLAYEDTGESIMDDVSVAWDAVQRDQRVYDEQPWIHKYGHVLLAYLGLMASGVAMLVPGPGWAAGITGAIATTIGIADTALFISEDDWVDAAISTAFLIVPVTVVGGVRLVRITRAELESLQMGGHLPLFGHDYKLVGGRLVPVGEGAPSLSPDIPTHVATVFSLNRNGVVGGHNLDAFEQAFRDLGVTPADAMIWMEKMYPGVYRVGYRVPKLAPNGKAIIPVEWKVIKTPKTVFDPAVVSDQQMLDWATEAMKDAKQVGETNKYVGYASNGMKFEGIVRNGAVTTVYPIPRRGQ